MILLWGVEDEAPLAAVHRALNRLRIPVAMLEQRDVLETEVDLFVSADVTGTITVAGRSMDLASVSAVYLRAYGTADLPAVAAAGPDSDAWRQAHLVESAIYTWIEITPALVISRPSAMASNASKPYQCEIIQKAGFCIPETLITTDPEAAIGFWHTHGAVIYKSISGIRSIVSRLRPEHEARLANVSWCPTQFQQYIPGRDHRVHVVGDEVFACEVHCDADDYRYPGDHPVEMRACFLPVEVADRCRLLSAQLSLPVAGVDLRRDHEGRWYCFEVNPCPAFSYYEHIAGLPNSDAIARLLGSSANRA